MRVGGAFLVLAAGIVGSNSGPHASRLDEVRSTPIQASPPSQSGTSIERETTVTPRTIPTPKQPNPAPDSPTQVPEQPNAAPHEPEGFTRISTRSFQARVEDNWTTREGKNF